MTGLKAPDPRSDTASGHKGEHPYHHTEASQYISYIYIYKLYIIYTVYHYYVLWCTLVFQGFAISCFLTEEAAIIWYTVICRSLIIGQVESRLELFFLEFREWYLRKGWFLYLLSAVSTTPCALLLCQHVPWNPLSTTQQRVRTLWSLSGTSYILISFVEGRPLHVKKQSRNSGLIWECWHMLALLQSVGAFNNSKFCTEMLLHPPYSISHRSVMEFLSGCNDLLNVPCYCLCTGPCDPSWKQSFDQVQ